MSQDTTSYDTVLKEFYEGMIRDQIPTKVKMYSRFLAIGASDWGGRYVTYPMRVGRNQGVGAYAEGGAFPSPGKQQYTDVYIPMRYIGGRIRMTAQVMRASQSSKAAFAPAFQQEQDTLAKDLQNEFGRIIWADGRGVLALVNGGSQTGASQTIDAPGGVAGATNGARFLNPGEVVCFVNPTTGVLRSSSDRTVIAVPSAGTSITLSSAISTNDNDYIVRANKPSLTDVSDSNYAKEPMGLLGLDDDGTYVPTLHGVNRTNYPIFSSIVIGSVGSLSSDVIMRGIDTADERGGGTTDLLAMHHSVRRSYIALTDSNRRYIAGDMSNPDAGTKAAKGGNLTFGGIELETDKYAPYGTIFGLDTSGLKRFVEISGEWVQDDGAILRPVGVGTTFTDEWEGAYRIWQNFHNEFPNRCFRLDGVTATVVVAHID